MVQYGKGPIRVAFNQVRRRFDAYLSFLFCSLANANMSLMYGKEKDDNDLGGCLLLTIRNGL